MIGSEMEYTSLRDIPIPGYLSGYVRLQDILDELAESKIDECFEEILRICDTKDNFGVLIENISHFVFIRPEKIDEYVQLSVKLINYFKSDNNNFAELLLKKAPRYFLYRLYKLHIYTIEQIKERCLSDDVFHLFFLQEIPFKRSWVDKRIVYLAGHDPPMYEKYLREAYDPETVEYAIKTDSVDDLMKFSISPDFNAMMAPARSSLDRPQTTHSLLAFAAKAGALKCFKFLLLSGAKVDEHVCQNAVKGGSYEIVHICDQNCGQFGSSVNAAVEYYRTELCDWMMLHKSVRPASLGLCLKSWNVRAFVFLLLNGSDPDERIDGHETVLARCRADGRDPLVRFLIERGAEKTP